MSDSEVNNCQNIALNIFELYSTSACHLCEEALEILNDLHNQMLELAKEQGVDELGASIYTIKLVDIADDDKLVNAYGTRIPVLIYPSDGDELSWPFDIQSAYQFILPKLVFS